MAPRHVCEFSLFLNPSKATRRAANKSLPNKAILAGHLFVTRRSHLYLSSCSGLLHLLASTCHLICFATTFTIASISFGVLNLSRKMKIFNWVHRKLKDGSAAQNAKKNGAIFDESGDANQFLVDNNAFGDSVFGCWKGGILTIGTFGYDALTKDAAEVDEQDYDHDLEFHVKDQDQESEELESAESDVTITDSEKEEVDEDEDEEEANPLVYSVYAHDCKTLLQRYDPAADYIKTNGNKDFDHVMMVMEENDRDVDADMKKDRITLADLFSADHWDADDDDHELQKKQRKKKLHELMEEKASSKKHGHGRLSFAKKLLLAGGAGDSKDTRPIDKLNRLVRRMLKRKIHPELGLVNKEVNESNIPKVKESVPLLPIPQGQVAMLFE